MPKQFRVITRTELISSYIVEVPDGVYPDDYPLEKLFGSNAWEEYILGCVYDDDVGSSGAIEAYALKEPVTQDDPKFFDYSNDGETVWVEND